LRILIADDNPAFLQQMVTLLGAKFDVVATAENGRIALAKTLQHRPDLVVLDLEMPFLNGIEIARELRKLTQAPAIVICSVENDEEIIEAARQAGALGYVFKMRMAQDLVVAVKSAARGVPFVSSPF
jgi:DNA-binding NarL/FixJ family response regulator